MIVIGIDPGPTLAESHCSVLQDEKFCFGNTWFGIKDGVFMLINESGPGKDTLWQCPTPCITAAVIEWIAPFAGIYTRKGEARPSRSRAGQVLQTHSAATTIRDALHNAGVNVYCVPRREICRQAGCHQADYAVTNWLELHGYIQVSAYDRRNNLHLTPEQIALGGDAPYGLMHCKRVTTPGLTTTHNRDALMAALFNTHDPRNAQYIFNPKEK